MAKDYHEIRDPLYAFIRLDSDERLVLDSRPFQRLRYIHQLALTYLVYPGATHRRFEHSLGVMELAGRVYDIITNADIPENVKETLPSFKRTDQLGYWRKVVRMAALCHDLGHLPFSHAAESNLLPEGWSHERLTAEIIRSPEMVGIWKGMRPLLETEDIVKIAVGPSKLAEFEKNVVFNNWESILAEIIVGNAFGVDRMDYLLRDSYHAGVGYGRFDHFRLIDTIRILPKEEDDEGSREPALGLEGGGLHAAESLLWARYFMFAQLYYHHVRVIYDVHLQQFLKEFLEGGFFSTQIEDHLRTTDEEIISELIKASADSKLAGHEPAKRIVQRDHFRVLYEINHNDKQINPFASKAVYSAARKEFGEKAVIYIAITQKGGAPDFPILEKDGRVVSSLAKSKPLNEIPVGTVEVVFVDPSIRNKAVRWLKKNRPEIIVLKEENDE